MRISDWSSDVCSSDLTVEDLAARLGDEEAGVLVAHRFVEPHRDATDRVHETLEADEVDLDVVVDRNPEVLLDRVDQHLLALSVGAVDPTGRAVGDGAPQVAGDRQARSEEHTSELQPIMRISYA